MRTFAGAVGPGISIAGANEGASKQQRMHDEASESSADADIIEGAKKAEDGAKKVEGGGNDEEGQVQSLLERCRSAYLPFRTWMPDALYLPFRT